jgi:hypothetical protein
MTRADPITGTVDCPTDIRFFGRISVAGGSGRVTYRWIRDDGASAPVQTVNFTGPGSHDVTYTWSSRGTPGSKVGGWMALRIIEPQQQDSNRADFDLSCRSAPG